MYQAFQEIQCISRDSMETKRLQAIVRDFKGLKGILRDLNGFQGIPTEFQGISLESKGL